MLKFLSKNFPRLRASAGASQAPELLFLQLKPLSTSARETRKSSTSDENKHVFTINYLKNVLGFTPERAVSASKYMHFETSVKPDSVISFFKNHGFTTTQMLNLAKSFPRVLLCDLEKTLLPKIEFFRALGFSNTEVAVMLSARPGIFQRSLKKHIQPSFELIKGILQSHGKALGSVRRYYGILLSDRDKCLIPNIETLKDAGVPESNVAVLLTYQPRAFTVSPPKFRKTVEEVKEMGFNPLRLKFVLAVHALRAMSKSTWEKKVEIYKKCGWSEDEIFEAFRRYPWCMTVSEEKIMAIMELLVDKLGFEPSDVLKWPVILSLSLQNRIIPRSIIYQALSKKGLIPKNFSLRAFLQAPEKKFVRRFVHRFQADAPELLTLYQKSLPPLSR